MFSDYLARVVIFLLVFAACGCGREEAQRSDSLWGEFRPKWEKGDSWRVLYVRNTWEDHHGEEQPSLYGPYVVEYVVQGKNTLSFGPPYATEKVEVMTILCKDRGKTYSLHFEPKTLELLSVDGESKGMAEAHQILELPVVPLDHKTGFLVRDGMSNGVKTEEEFLIGGLGKDGSIMRYTRTRGTELPQKGIQFWRPGAKWWSYARKELRGPDGEWIAAWLIEE